MVQVLRAAGEADQPPRARLHHHVLLAAKPRVLAELGYEHHGLLAGQLIFYPLRKRCLERPHLPQQALLVRGVRHRRVVCPELLFGLGRIQIEPLLVERFVVCFARVLEALNAHGVAAVARRLKAVLGHGAVGQHEFELRPEPLRVDGGEDAEHGAAQVDGVHALAQDPAEVRLFEGGLLVVNRVVEFGLDAGVVRLVRALGQAREVPPHVGEFFMLLQELADRDEPVACRVRVARPLPRIGNDEDMAHGSAQRLEGFHFEARELVLLQEVLEVQGGERAV